jgi:hypothetical protein
MAKNLITQAEVHRLLRYDATTGDFIWNTRQPASFKAGGHSAAHICARWNASYAEKAAGTINPNGYIQINVQRNLWYAHRLAWFFVHGEWPRYIDHINGDRSDNRIENLRSVTNAENHKNQGLRAINTSGVVGVSWLTRRQRWQARIMVDGLQVNLGHFRDFADATRARLAAEKLYGFHENHGSRPTYPEPFAPGWGHLQTSGQSDHSNS